MVYAADSPARRTAGEPRPGGDRPQAAGAIRQAAHEELPPWVFHRPRGTGRRPPGARPASPRPPGAPRGVPEAVLFDRDGTLVENVPYNGDPDRVRPMPWVLDALTVLRARGVPVGVVSNQSGVARGLLTPGQVAAVRGRVEQYLGPFDVWVVCPHGPDDGCGCRKPAPGLVLTAAGLLGVPPHRTAVVGDIGADMGAAAAAGARGVLVPTPVTRREEVAGAAEVAPNALAAVRLLLAGDGPAPSRARRDARPAPGHHAAGAPAPHGTGRRR
jgi:D-glycero-D-manno-heptose 1,7-bisphosphate phosphatase